MASSAIGSKRNVKIFVLYLMENINYPLDYATLNDIIMQTDYVMYLDFAESFNEMMDASLILEVEGVEENQPMYVVSEKGKIVARELNSDIITSILDKSLSAALRYLDFKKRGIEARCEYRQRPDQKFDFVCMLFEKQEKIFETTIVVDSLNRVERMKRRYMERPEVVYRGVVALLSGKMQFLFD